jgi:error-prone DNA polymerase
VSMEREGEVVYLVVHRVTDLSEQLATLGHRHAAFPPAGGRGDQAKTDGGPDPREILTHEAQNTHVSDRRSPEMIKVKTRDFR